MAPMEPLGMALSAMGLPGAAVVFGLPEASAYGAGVEGVGLGGVAGDGVGAASAHGAYFAPLEGGEHVGGELGFFLGVEGGGVREEQEGGEGEVAERQWGPRVRRIAREQSSGWVGRGLGASGMCGCYTRLR